MTRRYLVLGSPGNVALAYFVAPPAAMLTLWLCLVAGDIVTFQPNIGRALFFLPWLLILGSAIGYILELLLVAPLVAGFRRFGWRWANWLSVAAIGFLIGVLPGFLLMDGASFVVSGIAGVGGALTFACIAARPMRD